MSPIALWLPGPPTEPGVYLYEYEGCAVTFKVFNYRDLQQGVTDGLYATVKLPFKDNGSRKMFTVNDMPGKWAEFLST